MDTEVVTATRSRAKTFDTPYTADSVSGGTLERRSFRTVPQALRNVPGVMVQETSHGQGSPYIRGFTGFRTLLLIDGIRLNNSVFRDGPNQYWNTIDPFSIGRIEIVKGPSSVLYGSDAIGGTVQVFTRDPYGYAESGWGFGGRAYYRFASAENSHIGRLELTTGHGERTGLLAAATGKEFGDLVAGDPIGRQDNTAYDEWDGDVKIEHFLDARTRLVFAYQHVRQNNVPRTHRTIYARSFHGTTVGNELRRDLDQERWLVYAQLHKEDIGGAVDAVHASLSWQSQSETRDRIRTGDRRDKQGFDVGTLGFWTQLESPSAVGRFTYGFELYHDDVDSFSTSNPIQGPVADDATYDLLGLFVQLQSVVGRCELVSGLRVTYAAVDADRVANPDTGLPFSITDDWVAVVGSVHVLYHLVPDRWNLFGGVSQGFRAPNLSDLTRFDTARSNEFEIPAPGLDPEHFLTFETGIKGRGGERFVVGLSVFYTIVRDQIIRVPTGNTNADGDTEVTKDNVGDGWIYGIELSGSWRVRPQWTIFGLVAYLEGKVDTYPTAAPVVVREYIDRLMPLTAQLGLRWDEEAGRFWAEGLVIMADKADRLSTRDQGDTQRIPPGGTPGYAVVHLRAGWKASEKLRLTFAVENLFDKSYRVHGSGQNMPGTNFELSGTFDF